MEVSLGLDVGERRVGVALGDALGILATPLTTLIRESDKAAVAAIGELAAAHGAQFLVVGLPLTHEGALSAQAVRIRAFARKLRAIPQTRVVFWDERHTTVSAAERLDETRGGRPRRAEPSPRAREAARRRLDAAAAAVMLQDYLDQKRTGDVALAAAPHYYSSARTP